MTTENGSDVEHGRQPPEPPAAAPADLAELQRRMDGIRHEVEEEVDRAWVSPWRSPEMFEVKVSARLSAHVEYQSLLRRLREGGRAAEAEKARGGHLPGGPEAAGESPPN